MADDLISRQAALDVAMNDSLIINAMDSVIDGDIHRTKRAITRLLASLPSAPRWIPVTERLPEETGIYPVWTARGFGNHLSTSYWDGKEWSLRVVAWMQKPTPWKGEV